MKLETGKFEKAGSKRVDRPVGGQTWPVFEEYEVTKTEDDIILDAVLRPLRPSRLRSGIEHLSPAHYEDQRARSVKHHIVPPGDLFLTFARRMPQRSLDKEEAVEFVLSWVREYGVLGVANVDDGQNHWMRESVSGFFDELRRASKILSLYEAATPGAAQPGADVLKKTLGVREDTTLTASDLQDYAMQEVGNSVGEVVRDECFPLLARQVKKTTGRTKGFDYDLGFRSLLGAMYLQMMLWLTADKSVRRCARPKCRGIIPSHARADKKTCSDYCRKWWSDNIVKPGRQAQARK